MMSVRTERKVLTEKNQKAARPTSRFIALCGPYQNNGVISGHESMSRRSDTRLHADIEHVQ